MIFSSPQSPVSIGSPVNYKTIFNASIPSKQSYSFAWQYICTGYIGVTYSLAAPRRVTRSRGTSALAAPHASLYLAAPHASLHSPAPRSAFPFAGKVCYVMMEMQKVCSGAHMQKACRGIKLSVSV